MTYVISNAWLQHCLAGQMSGRDKASWPQGYGERSAFLLQLWMNSAVTGRQLLQQNGGIKLLWCSAILLLSAENRNWPKPEGSTTRNSIYMHHLLFTSCCFHLECEFHFFYAAWVTLMQLLVAGGHNMMSWTELTAFEPFSFYTWLLSMLADVSLRCTKCGLTEERWRPQFWEGNWKCWVSVVRLSAWDSNKAERK